MHIYHFDYVVVSNATQQYNVNRTFVKFSKPYSTHSATAVVVWHHVSLCAPDAWNSVPVITRLIDSRTVSQRANNTNLVSIAFKF